MSHPFSMKKIVTVLALCLIPLSAAATEQKVWKDAPLAPDQSLPHGLNLLPGHYVVYDPDQKEILDPEKGFGIKVPSSSGHKGWWSEQYVQQLEALGWTASMAMHPMRMMNRQIDQCREQMILLSLGPDSHKSGLLKNSDMPIFEFNLVAFSYSNSGTCETK